MKPCRYNAFPFGGIINRNINIRTGQAPVIPYMPTLYNLLAVGKVDPNDTITHRLPLSRPIRSLSQVLVYG